MTHAMEALYKDDKPFLNRFKILENTQVILVKVTSNDIQALKSRINDQDKDLYIVNTTF